MSAASYRFRRVTLQLAISLAALALLPPGESSGSTAHFYSFTGHFLQDYCTLDHGKCYAANSCRKKLEFAVEARYHPGNASLHEKTTIRVPYGDGPGTVTCADPNARCDTLNEITSENDGSGVTIDPWIAAAQIVQGWDIREAHPWKNLIDNGMPHFPPSQLFSSCAFTDAERAPMFDTIRNVA